MKQSVNVKSFYYGFPVLLISTLDSETGAPNITPVSSSFSLGKKVIIGISKGNKAFDNVAGGSDVVINIPDYPLWETVERLGRLTGRQNVAEDKRKLGYQFCSDKLGTVGLHPEASETVRPPRITECPIQAECRTVEVIDRGVFVLVDLEINKIWIDPALLNEQGKLDTARWQPLINKFREYDTTSAALGVNFKHGE